MSIHTWTKTMLILIGMALAGISIFLYFFLFHFDPLEGTTNVLPFPNLDIETYRQLDQPTEP